MTRWVRAAASGILLAAMLIGLPVLLIVLAGWPFPSASPDWGNVGRMLRQGDVPADAVIKTLAVVLWVLWVGLVWSFVWELRTCLTSVSRGERPPRPSAPAVPAAMSAWVGRLVAAALALGAVSTPSSSSVAAPSLPAATVVVDAAGLTIPVVASSHAVMSPRSVPAVARQWVTGPADTVWDIAERALGDGLRVDEIVGLNPGLRPARPLPAGRSIALPADAAVPADRRPVTSTAPPEPATLAAAAETSTASGVPVEPSTEFPAAGYLSAGEVTVEAGDNLWDLSEERLAAAGVHDDDAATATLIAEVIGINPDVVEDPNMIYVGETFRFPAVGTPPATEQATSTDGTLPVPVGADLRPAAVDDSPTASPSVLETVTDHVVTANESYWSIATDQLRAELGAEPHDHQVLKRTEELIATNSPRLGHDDPAMLHVGDVVQPVAPATLSTTPPTDGSAVAYQAATTYVVVEGDSLSEIVEMHYGRSDGELVWAVSAFNNLENPGSISAGQLLELPVLTELVEASPASGAAPVNVPNSVVAEPSTPTDVVRDHVDPAPPTEPTPPEPAATVPVTLPSAPTTVPPGSASASSTRDTPRVPPSRVDDDQASGFEQAQRTVWWSVPMGLLLASGIVLMARRLRNRRLHSLEPGEQLQSPPPVAAGTELAATVAARAPTRLATLRALLRSVTPHARELDDPPPVRAVELSDDRVEILFAEPAPFPPSGWSSPDGGRSWIHRIVEGAAPGDAEVTQLVTPALVTLGRRRGGGEVMLDVETAGSAALVGDRAACLGLARSVALELGTYPLGVPMDVCLVGVDVDGLEHCDRAWANTTMTRAVRVARDMLERTTATGEPSLMAARVATDEDEGMLDPQVFIVDKDALSPADAALLDELVDLCQPQAGAAVVVIGEHRAAREVIRVDDGGAAEWAGASLDAPVLTREAVAQVAVTFEHAATAAVEPLTPSPVVADLLDGGDSQPAARDEAGDGGEEPDADERQADADSDDATVPYVAPTPDVLVRLMGEVDVVGRDVMVASDVELLALLVCLRDRSPNIDTITTVLGRDKIKPIQNRVSTLRAKLGVGSDGEELLPLARSGRGAQGRYRVSRLVMTDVELLEHRYQCSLSLPSQDALAVLRDGLTLMAGPAFRARKGFNWATPEGVQSRVASIVNAYAARLMELAFESDQLDLVVEAARCAGRVIDDPVAEVPMRRLEREYAEASGNPELWAAVAEATRRLGLYAEETHRLAPDDEF